MRVIVMNAREDAELLAISLNRRYITKEISDDFKKLPLIVFPTENRPSSENEFIQTYVRTWNTQHVLDSGTHILPEYVAMVNGRYIYVKTANRKIQRLGLIAPELKCFVWLDINRAKKDINGSYDIIISTSNNTVLPRWTSKRELFTNHLSIYTISLVARILAFVDYQARQYRYGMLKLPVITAQEEFSRKIKNNSLSGKHPVAPSSYHKKRDVGGGRIVFLDKLPKANYKGSGQSDVLGTPKEGHPRRGHYRLLYNPCYANHPMYCNPVGIFIRPTWVGPKTTIYEGFTYTVI